MAQFIILDVLFLAVAALLLLAIRTLPRMGEPAVRRGYLERLVLSEIPERVDTTINYFLVKFLRRAKVVLLKVENSVNKNLHRLKADLEDTKSAMDFKNIDSGLRKDQGENNSPAI